MRITEFLLARIAEDEQRALDARDWVAGGPEPRFTWFGSPGEITVNRFGAAAPHIAAMSPARILSECAAKRAIVEGVIQMEGDLSAMLLEPLISWHYKHSMQWFIRPFAAAYKDHPDYRREWE